MAMNGTGLNSGGLRSGGLRKTTTHAASVGAQLIDSWEDGDMAEYTDSEADGGAAEFDVIEPSAFDAVDGSHVLRLTETADTQWPKAVSTSGLGAYPQRGDEWATWIYFEGDVGNGDIVDSGDMGIYFGAQDADNTYYVNIRWYDDSMRIYEDDAGTANGLAVAENLGLQSDAWYKVIVQWDDGSTFGGADGDITFILENAAENVVASINASPTVSYQSGGFGVYGAARGIGSVYWEYAHIASEEDTGSGGGGGDTTTIESFESQSFDAYNIISDEGSEVFYWTDPQSEAEPIGGGWGYQNTVAEADADYTVTTSSELRSALDSASAGDIVYVTSNINTVGESYFTVPSGVTLAGNRGLGGAGNIIYIGKRNRGFYLGAGSRLTGLQVQGPWPNTWSTESKDDDDWHQKGVNVNGDNAEIDNNHIYGFGYSCLQLTNDNASSHPDGVHIHHNNIHHGVSNGWGYGCDTYQATNALFEYNRFAHCRHQITGSGEGSYTVRHNLHEEPNTHNVIDMHQPGGIRTDVYRNTIVAHDTDIDGLPGWASSNPATSGYIQREIPDDLAQIHNNWMWNPYPPPADKPKNPGFDETAIDQAFPESWSSGEDWSWENVEFWDNEYDADVVAASDRRARDGRHCRDAGERCLVYYGSRKRRGMISTSGLDNYPSAGDTWRFFWRGEGKPFGLCQILFGVQDETEAQNYYELDIREGEIRLEVDVAGEDTQLASQTWAWDATVPYEIQVDWPADPASTGMTITATNQYTGEQMVNMTADPDDTYITGGFGFYGNSWSGFLLDDFSIV